ncbi:ATP-dependent nuclease [Herbaspirillum rubrisubalbicans]|uniref:ATP-dependent nuclease n=1 Tax=Herbaspirillum rubrisubalbicans TaxID=80842 RepID=UPI0015583DF5|nr:AAA family ATPase [Herbaspirillum rubrisubalbicans]
MLRITEIRLSGVRGINYHIAPDADIYGSDAGFHSMPLAELSDINVFSGPNGAGKSTFIDTVHCISNTEKLMTLKRSKLTSEGAYYSFRLGLSDGSVVDVQYSPGGKIQLKRFSSQKEENILEDCEVSTCAESKLPPPSEAKVKSFMTSCNVRVEAWDSLSKINFDISFFEKLRQLEGHLTGVRLIEGSPSTKSGFASILFEDEPDQKQEVSPCYLPSGWKAAAGLLAWADLIESGSICVIEEPETHLHPRLQIPVIQELARIAKDKKLQLLIATHSPTFINPKIWHDEITGLSTTIFHVSGKNISVANRGKLLDSLGAKVSDLLQTNCVIWVEGPSDRMYIRHWLEAMIKEYKLPALYENEHFSFALYGGSCLGHFDASDSEIEDTISMLSLNRNSFVVMDRDFDFSFCAATNTLIRSSAAPSCVNQDGAKFRVLSHLGHGKCWISDAYTIEGYLPQKYFDSGKITLNKGRIKVASKVSLAREYRKENERLGLIEQFGSHAPKPLNHLLRLYKFIQAANK